MKHYTYHQTLRSIWEKAVDGYGTQKPRDEWYTSADKTFLASIGMSEQEMFDYAEDYNDGGDPDFTNMALVMDVRRAYFLEVQNREPSEDQLDPSTLPAKTESVRGIVWLPRILPKAKAKLRGELDPDIMYGCGGDRRFFKENDIHPAEFLRIVWQNIDDDAAVIDWVEARRYEGEEEE